MFNEENTDKTEEDTELEIEENTEIGTEELRYPSPPEPLSIGME